MVSADRHLGGVNDKQAGGNCGQGVKLAGELRKHPTCERNEAWISGEGPKLMGRGAFGALEHPGKEINPFWEDAQCPHHLQWKLGVPPAFPTSSLHILRHNLLFTGLGLHTGKIWVIILMASAEKVETCQQGGLSSIKVLLFSFPATSEESRICLSSHQVRGWEQELRE